MTHDSLGADEISQGAGRFLGGSMEQSFMAAILSLFLSQYCTDSLEG